MSFDQLRALNYAVGARDYSTKIVHYTSEENLKRILTSNELWFGRIDQMTDASEYSHYIEAIKHVVPDLVPMAPKTVVTELFNSIDGLVRTAAYISSWCEYWDDSPEGSLQMWRAYGNGARGVAAVVDSSNFQPSNISERKFGFFINSSKVEYVKTNDIRETANSLLNGIRDSGVLNRIPNAEIILGSMLVAKAPTTKHQSFREEQEVRFLSLPKFRESSRMYVPNNCFRSAIVRGQEKHFFALPLKHWEEFEFDLRLSTVLLKVLIGPLDQPENRRDRMRDCLDKLGLGHVPVEIVGIPLRE